MITKENVKIRLEKELRKCDDRIKSWQKVTRNRKKDGSDFAYFEKNFNNLSFGCKFSDSIEIKVYGRYPDYSEGTDNTYVRGTEPTVDEVFQTIEDRIEYLRQRKAEILDNLSVMNNLYDETVEELTIIKDRITEIAGNRTELWYIMMEVVEKHYYSTPPKA